MTLSGDFAEAGIELNGLDNEAFERVARELYEYAEENALAPGWAPVTDENGRIKLQDLTVGVYLVVGRPAVMGDRVHYSLPQLIVLPQYDEVNAEWDYAVSIALKSISIGIDEELLDLTVEKKWIDQGFEEFRPYYIMVNLLWNGKLYDSVYLSEENNWTYTWTDLLPIGEWTVEEEIPTDYVLEIPSLGLTLPVISQNSSGNLLKAPCRFFGSAYTGNLVIGAHNYATHFGRIRELSYGDRVIFTDMAGNVFVYEAADMETLRPYEGSQLCNGLWDLTLYTCTFGGEQRMTIRCEQVNAY